MLNPIQKVSIKTADDIELQGYLFTPAADIKGKIVIAAAMGAAQSYYQPISEWLSQQGYVVLTFDYRGVGESLNQPLKHYQTDLLDWAKLDCSAALKFILDKKITAPTYWLGNSLGGQVFPLVEGIEQVKKVITFSSGTGYWKRNAPELRWKAPLLWYLIVPMLTPLLGYFPGKKLNMVGDLPKGVIYQWRRWCLHPEYCVGVEPKDIRAMFNNFSVPIHSICFTDDEMLSLENMQDLHALFGAQNKKLTAIEPTNVGIKRVGHLGFFKEKFRDNLWPHILLPELD